MMFVYWLSETITRLAVSAAAAVPVLLLLVGWCAAEHLRRKRETA